MGRGVGVFLGFWVFFLIQFGFYETRLKGFKGLENLLKYDSAAGFDSKVFM